MSRAVIDPYLKIQAALADDSMDGVHGERRRDRDRGDARSARRR